MDTEFSVPSGLIGAKITDCIGGTDGSNEIEKIRKLLEHCQKDAIDGWSFWLNDIGRGQGEIVFENEEAIVIDINRERPGDRLDTYDGDIELNNERRQIVTEVHRSKAQELTGDSWEDTNPFVVQKPEIWQTVEEHVIRRIGTLSRERGSVGRGADAFAVNVQGQSQQFWANRTDRTRQAVNNSLNRGDREARSAQEATE
jgi:hypothetical protein